MAKDQPLMCEASHICMDCKQSTLCNTYRFACPWINDDELKMCDGCLEKLADDMYKFEAEQETLAAKGGEG